MKTIIRIFLLIIISNQIFSQDFNADFGKYFKEKNQPKQKETLEKWTNSNPNDPELYTSYFNYYFNKSRNEVLTLSKEEPDGERLEFKDSLNKTAGYIGSEVKFNKGYFQKGIDKINKGIELYPDRLDMRFGAIYAFGEVKDWANFTNEIVKAVKHSVLNNNEWTWTNNIKQKEGKDFFLSSIQTYQLQLYNTGDDKLLNNMREIATEILKLYPTHVESLSNLSITYMLKNEYDKAIEVLLKAESINPKDFIVLSNVAHAYKLKGDKLKAIEYYEKTIKYGDDQSVDYAKKQIIELKKQTL